MDFKKLAGKFIILVIIVSIILFGIYFLYVKSKDNDNITYYKQGLEYYNKEDYQNAYYNFSKILPFSNFYLNSLFKQAKCADILNDTKTALNKYKILELLIQNEDITPFVLWREGNIYYKKEDFKSAKNILLKLRKSYPDTEYGIASNYILFKIENNKEYLIEYIKNSPNGKYTKELLDIILKDKNLKLTDEEKVIVSNALFENELYKEEIVLLKTVPINFSWIYMLKALDKLNSPQNVIKVAQKGFSIDNSKFDEDVLNDAIDIYLKYASDSYSETNKIYETAKDYKIKGIALYKNSNLSPYNEGLNKKIKVFENYKNLKIADYALFELFVESVKNNKIPNALKYGKIHLSLYKNKETTPLILYFTAYMKKKNTDEKYKELTTRLFKEFPNSYYSYLAYSNLINPNFSNRRTEDIPKNIFINYPDEKDKKIKVFYENFIKTGDFKPFEDFRIKNPVVQSWVEYKKGNRAQSSVIARNYILGLDEAPNRSDIVWMLAYPIYYSNEINYFSDINKLNPYLFLSLIKEESHFNPNIRSEAGAVGLTQIMPATAEMISGQAYTDTELTDEKLNIELGAKYFSYLMGEFLNKEELCILAYNSGPNSVKKWLNENNSIHFDVMVEKIPYPETKYYIKKIYGAYWNYVLTYENLKI